MTYVWYLVTLVIIVLYYINIYMSNATINTTPSLQSSTASYDLITQSNLHNYHRRRDSVDIIDYVNENTDLYQQLPNDAIRQLDDAIVAKAMLDTDKFIGDNEYSDNGSDGVIDDKSQPNFVLYDQPAYLWTNTDPKPYLSSSHVDGGMSMIFDWLYLGARSNAADLQQLTGHHITHIYNTCTESPNFFPNQFHYTNVPVDDKQSEADKLYDKLPHVTQQLHDHYIHHQQHSSTPHHVLVHCVAGVSRSPTIVSAYLIRYHNMSLIQSIHTIQQSRDRVQPNAGFIDILARWEKQYIPNKSTLAQTKRLLHHSMQHTNEVE